MHLIATSCGVVRATDATDGGEDPDEEPTLVKELADVA